jgi:hypothetical protein
MWLDNKREEDGGAIESGSKAEVKAAWSRNLGISPDQV